MRIDVSEGAVASGGPPRWHVDFRLERDPFGTRIPLSDRCKRVTETALRGMSGNGPDQIAPGFFGLGPALVVRNLVLEFLGNPPLVVLTTDSSLVSAYHALKDPIMSRWATKYPMYYLSDRGLPRPVSRRGLPRSRLPAPALYLAHTAGEAKHWLGSLTMPKLLIIVGSPSEVPDSRPEASHVVLQGVLGDKLDDAARLRRPCGLVLPSGIEGDSPSLSVNSIYATFSNRERNVSRASVEIEGVHGLEEDLGRLSKAYRTLARQAWDRWGGFLGTCKSVHDRLEADALPISDPPPRDAGVTTDSLIQILEHLVQLGQCPPVPESRSFVTLARSVVRGRTSHSSGKGTWVETHPQVFSESDYPFLLVESRFSAARWMAYDRDHAPDSRRYVAVPLGTRGRIPLVRRVLVPAAPSSRLLSDLVAGASPESTILLYEWENASYNAARSRLMAYAQSLGLQGWPRLPDPVSVAEWHPSSETELVPHERTFDWNWIAQEESIDTDLPSLTESVETGPVSVISTPANTYRLPTDRVIVVLRGKTYHELEACNAKAGDVLVVARGTSDPSASRIIERLCRKNEVMNRTRSMAGMWRDALKQYVAANFTGRSVAEAHRGMHPEVSVTYPEFLHWLRDGEPVTPTRPNLLRLMARMGYGGDLALMIYAEGLHHKRDRREILHYVQNIANSKLDQIYEGTLTSPDLDSPLSLSVEDVIAVVGFEPITAVQEVDASRRSQH